jgi:hypothetical protein
VLAFIGSRFRGIRPPAPADVVDRCGVRGARELEGEFFVEAEEPFFAGYAGDSPRGVAGAAAARVCWFWRGGPGAGLG